MKINGLVLSPLDYSKTYKQVKKWCSGLGRFGFLLEGF